MAEEDQFKRGSSGGSGFQRFSLNSGSSSKKPTQKKAPRRGLGIEKLEQMRLQERQKKDAAAVASPSILPSPSSPSLNPVNPPLSNQCSSSISSPSVSQAPLSSSNLVTRLPFPTYSVYFENSVPVTLMNQTSFAGFMSPRPRITVLGQEDGTKRLHSRQHVHRGNFGADPGLPFQSNAILPYQSNIRNPPSISANSAWATMSPPMLNFFPTEPPSNQNMHYHYLPAQRPEILGMKRPYPFSPDVPLALALNRQWLTSTPSLDESIGSSRNPNFRNRLSHSTSTCAQNKNKSTENSLSLSGDFLSLATPSANPELHHRERFRFKLLPFQTSDEDPTTKSEDSASKSSEESLDLELRL